MKSVFDDYTLLTGENPTFFAGANTGRGFMGAYPFIAAEDEKEHVYILKGGSGTGKSTFIRKLAADAEEDGQKCVYYLCSSDPDSLDAAVIDNRLAVVDGTAPHVWEMQYPGVTSELVYMGKYWKQEFLKTKKAEIQALCQQKSEAYRKGYRILAALEILEEEQYQSAGELLDIPKMEKFIGRLMKSVPRAMRTGETETYRTWAISMKGLVRTDGLLHMGDTHWEIEDQYHTAPWLLTTLVKICRQEKVPCLYSIHPINDRIVEVCVPSLSLTVSVTAGKTLPDKTISMRRFLRKELRAETKGEIRLLSHCTVSMLADVCEKFRDAGEAHQALEEIYKAAMNFTAMNRETEALRSHIRKMWSEK